VPHTHPLLQIGDVELCLGALAVEGVEGNGGARQIGEEGEVALARPQRRLGSHEPCAPDDEAPSVVGRLGDGGLSAF